MQRNVPIGWRMLGVTVALAAISVSALADSSTVAYQGILRNTTGTAVADGNYPMVFTIWDAATAGNQLWLENHGTVAAKDGVVSVQLGETVPLGTLFSDHSALWLQIAVDTGTGSDVYAPRVPFASVPYAKQAVKAANAANAVNAVNADTLDGVHAAGFALVSHNHAGESITSGTISTDRYSAYADLVAETKIGAGATQVAQGDHRHSTLPWFVGQVGGELIGTKTLGTVGGSGITNTGTALVATVAGKYFVHFQQLMQTNAGAAIYLHMMLNGSSVACGYFNPNVMEDMIVSRYVDMAVGDQITFVITAGPANNAWGGAHSSVSMYLAG